MARKKNSLAVFSVLLLVALLLALTNPGMSQFKNWMQASAERKTTEKTGIPLVGAISGAVSGLVSNEYSRTNLGLLSLYANHDSKGRTLHVYLGAARLFVQLK